jgi:hypothetical protein
MNNRKILGLACAAGLILVLAACSPSSDALTPTIDTTLIYTQAAQTVAAQFTQTSAVLTAVAPTQTDLPTSTPTISVTITPFATQPIFTGAAGTQPVFFSTPTLSLLPLAGTPTGALCDNSAYIRDIGTPDGTILKPNQEFPKGWLIQNTGTCRWIIGYRLVRVGGNTEFGGDLYVIRSPGETVSAGSIVEISLNLIAPKLPGLYEARYQMYTNKDVPFGTGMTVAVEVRK